MNRPDETLILQKVTEIFEQLNIAYAIGGSIASSVYGKVRFTQDADITVENFSQKADDLYALMKSQFYINKDTMYQALKNSSFFNIIHLQSAFKIDIYIEENDDFHKQLLSRSRKIRISQSTGKLFSVVSAEDIILLKLLWYKSTEYASQRQWSDALGVLAVQKDSLDFNYLKLWSAKLEVNDLLQKAVSESNL